jgi:hypothetical protein
VGQEGESYRSRYVGSHGAAVVNRERVRHLFAGDPQEDIPTALFRKN